MNKLISFSLRRPYLTLFILFAVTVALAPGILLLEFDNSVESFMPRQDGEYVFYQQMKDIYGDNGRFVIMAVSAENLWSADFLGKLNDLMVDIEEYKDFNRAKEEARLALFDKATAGGSIRFADLAARFNDDPPFRRLLERAMGGHAGADRTLTGRDIKKIRSRILRALEFKRMKVVDTVLSPVTAKDIRGAADTLVTYDLIEKDGKGNRIIPSTPEAIRTFRNNLERNPAFDKGLYARDPVSGDITDFAVIIRFINLRDQDPTVREMYDIIQGHNSDRLNIITTGVPIVNIWMNDYMHADLFKNVPLVLLVMAIVFFFNFRSYRGVILPLTTLVLTEVWIMGLMGYCGIRITAVGVALPPLMLAVGSSYSIHIMNQYYADFPTILSGDKKQGLRRSMTHISLTVLLAGITTALAFTTLVTSEISAIREWGVACGVGVMFAVFISSTLLPASLMLLPHRMPRLMLSKNSTVKKTVVDRIVTLATKGAVSHYRAVIAVVCLILIVSIAGMFRLKVETEFLTYFKEHDPVRVNTHVIGEKFGGGWGFNILIDSGKPDGAKDPRFLREVEDLRQWLVADTNPDLNIGRTEAFTDFVKTMHMAMNNDDAASFAIPDRRSDIEDYLEIYSGDDDDSDGRYDAFEPFVDGGYRTVNLFARLTKKQGKEVGTTVIKEIAEKMSSHIEGALSPPYSFHISGFPMMDVKLVYYIVKGQINNLLLSLAIIGVIVILLFSRFRAGPLALIPMSVAVIINFGIMGWFGIKLDMATSIIAALTIGIGVDDTIHFLNTYRHNRAKGLGVDETIAMTLAQAGKAIIYTSLALIFGFSVLITSHFIPIIIFGILTASTMINTTIGALLILPTLIKATNVDLSKPGGSFLARHLSLDKWFGLEAEE